MSDGSRVGNDVSGSVGQSVQAGEVHGDVHLHQRTEEGVVPRQLPSAAGHFVNRAVEQDALTTLLGGSKADGVVLLSTIDGTAGVGKSTLAVHWAHRMRDRFADGELYVNLRGFDPVAEPMTSVDALGAFLAALEVPAERIPGDADSRAALFRSLLHGKQMLVLLDNAQSAEQVRPLLPGGTSSLVLVTSRNRLDDLVMREGASRVTLPTLTDEEAGELLARYVGRERLDAEPDAVASLIGHCAGLPLALSIVAVRAGASPDVPLEDLVAELSDERERLDALDSAGDSGVRAVFSWSYRSLSPEAGRLFRLLGLPTGPDIGVAAIADLAGLNQRRARALLGELAAAHLVDQHTRGRYRFHDLLRAYAAECAAEDEPAEQRSAATRRLLDHYLRTSFAIERKMTSHGRFFTPELPESDVVGRSFEDDHSGLNWWETERANLVSAVWQASRQDLYAHAWQIPHTLMYFFRLRGYTEDWIATYRVALDSARQLDDRAGQAYLLHDLSVAYYVMQHYDTAARYAADSLPLFEETGDRDGLGVGLISLAHPQLDAGRYDEAVESFQRALELGRELENRFNQGLASGGLGLAYAKLGRFDEAFPYFEAALRLDREVGEDIGEGFVLNNMADAYRSANQLDQAIATYRKAVEFRRGIRHRQGEAESLRALGTALREFGAIEDARDSWQRAVTLFEELGNSEAEDIRAELESLSQ